jgi:chemotaxis signal transduction protein
MPEQNPQTEGWVRLVSVDAGHFRLALPVAQVQQIVGRQPKGMPDLAIGEEAPERSLPEVNLAEVLRSTPLREKPASLVILGPRGPILAEVCNLHRFLEVREKSIRELPKTVATRWPGLVRGVVRHDQPHVLLDGNVLGALMQAHLDEKGTGQ